MSAPGGGVCSGGVSAPRGCPVWGEGVSALGGGGVCSGGCLGSAPGGCLLWGVVICSWGGVCSRGVSAPGGGIPACTAADTPTPPLVDRHTPVKT